MNHLVLNQPYEPYKDLKERLTKMSLESLCAEIVQHRELDSLSFAEREIVSRLEKLGRLRSSSDGWVGERVAN
jgi:hypothetical protein